MKNILNHKEEQIMRILWNLKKGFVQDIIEEMESPKPPYNTVSSIVRKLVKQEVIGYESFGKTHRYFAILKKEDYRNESFKSMLQNYFEGSPEKLLSYFFQEEKLSIEEITSLLDKIKD